MLQKSFNNIENLLDLSVQDVLSSIFVKISHTMYKENAVLKKNRFKSSKEKYYYKLSKLKSIHTL